MVGYINSVRDREYKQCTPEIFEQLVQSPMVTTHIEEYRKGNEKSKSLLPAFLFQGYDPNVLLGKRGSRLAKALKPTGFFIMDFDHKEDAHGVYDKFLKKLPSLGFELHRDVALAHITPSGKGLRLVLRLPKGMTIEEAQTWTAKVMEEEIDRVVKDLSRLSFCPMASDILYINKGLLFGNVAITENPVRDALSVAQGFNPGIQNDTQTSSPSGEASVIKETSPKGEDATANDKPGVETPRYKEDVPPAQSGAATSQSVTPYGATAECGDEDTTSNNRAASTTPSIFPETYNGIPYKRIVEELILLHGGEPQVGNRENTIFRLASDLAKITDRSAPWLESLIPTFGLPESEWRTTIAQVCKKPLETSMSRKLQEAIKRCEAVKSEEEAAKTEQDSSNLPPKMPDNLPPLIAHLVSNVPDHLKAAVCMMSFPALATHVSNCKFQMLDGTEEELGLAACLLAKQSGGKSSVKKPIELIMADIDQADDISRERLRLWAEKRKNKKANEKGEPKPRVPIRWLDEDITSAAFFERLGCAEDGDEGRPNQCCYTHCNELEKLYNFNSRGGKAEIRQTIKGAFDRDRVGSCRATADAVNEKTFLRWNWTACSTIENGKDFFSGKMITDGAVSRVDFCTIIPPAQKQRYQIARYDKAWRDTLAPYVKALNDYQCETDENGDLIPAFIPESIALEEYLDNLTGERNAEMVDDVYEDYGRRCRVMTVKKMITLYIAHGQQWLPSFDAFARWMFDYSMWAKMAFFYDKASEAFWSESVNFKGNWSPLKMMKRQFTFASFSAVCQKNADRFKGSPMQALYRYKNRGIITQEGDTYTICEAFCKKHGIS